MAMPSVQTKHEKWELARGQKIAQTGKDEQHSIGIFTHWFLSFLSSGAVFFFLLIFASHFSSFFNTLAIIQLVFNQGWRTILTKTWWAKTWWDTVVISDYIYIETCRLVSTTHHSALLVVKQKCKVKERWPVHTACAALLFILLLLKETARDVFLHVIPVTMGTEQQYCTSIFLLHSLSHSLHSCTQGHYILAGPLT